MDAPELKIVNSFHATESTIRHDNQVYRWFVSFIAQKTISRKLSLDSDGEKGLTFLKKTFLLDTIILILIILNIILLIYFKNFGLIISLIIFGLTLFLNHGQKKRLVSQLSLRIIKQDYPEEILRQTTLYQMIENYSQTLNIPSIVDKIYFSDYILRYTFFVVFVVFFLVLSVFTTFQNEILLITACYTMSLLVRSNLIYNRLK